MRQDIANKALANLKAVTDMSAMEGYISIPDAVRLCREYDCPWSASTIQQNSSRGLYKGQKVNGELHIDREGLLNILKAESPDK